jgi:hypothetical protein
MTDGAVGSSRERRVWILSVGSTVLSTYFWLVFWFPAATLHESVSPVDVEFMILLHLASLAPATVVTARRRVRRLADGGVVGDD